MNKGWILAGATLAAILFGFPLEASADMKCSVIAVEGPAFLTHGQEAEREAAKGDAVLEGDAIRTGAGGRWDVAYGSRENIIRIDSNAQAVLKRLDPFELKLDAGSAFHSLHGLPPNSAYEVQMPVAVAGVRGSVFRTSVGESGAGIFNYSDSPVSVWGMDKSGARMPDAVVLKNEEKTSVAAAGERPGAPAPMSLEEIDAGARLKEALQESRKSTLAGTGIAGWGALAEQALNKMAEAYQAKDLNGFMENVSQNYPFFGELREFVQRDFRDYESVRLNLFMKRTTETQNGANVQADWQIQFFPTSVGRPLEARGENLEFVFVNEDGRLKMLAMRGRNPLFGARSPEVAASAGAPASVVRALQEAEDSTSRQTRQAALLLVSSGEPNDSAELTPVGVRIIAAQGFSGGNPTSLTGMIGPITLQLQVQVKLTDNARGIRLSNVVLEVRDSRTGQVLRGTGTIQPDGTSTIRTSDSITVNSSTSGVFTFVLDPEKQFNFLDRREATTRESYNTI